MTRSHPLSIRNLLLLTVGALTLLIAFLILSEVYQQWDKLEKLQALKTATLVSDPLFETMEQLSIGRDMDYSLLFTDDATLIQNLRPRLLNTRKEADTVLTSALEALQKYDFPGLGEQIRDEQAQIAALHETRKEIDAALALPLRQRDPALAERAFDQISATIRQTENVWLSFIKYFREVDPIVTLQIRFKYDLRAIMENSAKERALIGKLIVKNADPSPSERANLLRWQGAAEEAWSAADTLADEGKLYPGITLAFKEAKSHYDNVYGMVQNIFYVPDKKHADSYPFGTDFWFELSEETSDSFYVLKTTVIKETHAYLDMLEAKAQRAILLQLALLMCAVLICAFSFHVTIRRVMRPIDSMINALINVMQGKASTFTPSTKAGDEIGKLEQVLYAFQKSTADIIRTAAEKEKLIQDLERSNRELDDFAYIASHDLKEPLRGLHNHSRFLLEDNQGKLDAESTRKLNRLLYLSQRMEKLVNDLLYFSRLGRQDLAIQQADINAAIKDIQEMLELFLTERHARIVIPKTLPTITCDKTRVTELFRNLITNAVKYNDRPDKIIEVGFMEHYVVAGKPPAHDVFYVRDNGRGIASEFYEEIFRIFKRLQSSDESEQGTGVGLTFVKKIVERHGGHIWLESTPGAGTTFYFTLKNGGV